MPHTPRAFHRATGYPVRLFQLGTEPGDNLSATSTAEERLVMVELLSHRMWELTGRSQPTYSPATIPVQLVRRG